jgi:hypothetical protein
MVVVSDLGVTALYSVGDIKLQSCGRYMSIDIVYDYLGSVKEGAHVIEQARLFQILLDVHCARDLHFDARNVDGTDEGCCGWLKVEG